MEYRSTNPSQHLLHNVVAGVESSHGVEIGTHPTSTGAAIQSVGDDANITLSIFAKGAGSVVVGNSSNPLSLGTASSAVSLGSTLVTIGATGGQILMAGSTAPFSGFVRFTDTAVSTPAAFNDTTCGRVAETTHVLTGVNSSHYLIPTCLNLPAGISLAGAYAGSTVGDVHLRLVKGTTAAIAATSCTINFLAFRF
jgi:hypothetical protein